MKRKGLIAACVITVAGSLGPSQAATPHPQTPNSAASPTTTPRASAAAERALLDQYCVTCHNDRTKTANLSLEELDLATVGDHPELWEKVVRKLRAGVMPPPDMKRPLAGRVRRRSGIGSKRKSIARPPLMSIRDPSSSIV